MFDLTGKRALVTGASGARARLPAKVGSGFALRQSAQQKPMAALKGKP